MSMLIPLMKRSSRQRICFSLVFGLVAGAIPWAWAHEGHHHEGQPAPASAVRPSQAGVQVNGAWVRATVKGQQGTGGFMRLVSAQPLALVGFSSPAAATSELHEMRMDGSVMRMRPVDMLELPAGQPVDLKPGGHHLMLMGLKQPLKAGSTVPLVLKFKTPDGKLIEQRVTVPVRSAPPAGASSPDVGDHQHHDHHPMTH